MMGISGHNIHSMDSEEQELEAIWLCAFVFMFRVFVCFCVRGGYDDVLIR